MKRAFLLFLFTLTSSLFAVDLDDLMLPTGSAVDGWQESSWAGLYFEGHAPWVYSDRYGWMHVTGSSADAIQLWIPHFGTFTTSSDAFPRVYSDYHKEWLHLHVRGSETTRKGWFYCYSTREWFSADALREDFAPINIFNKEFEALLDEGLNYSESFSLGDLEGSVSIELDSDGNFNMKATAKSPTDFGLATVNMNVDGLLDYRKDSSVANRAHLDFELTYLDLDVFLPGFPRVFLSGNPNQIASELEEPIPYRVEVTMDFISDSTVDYVAKTIYTSGFTETERGRFDF